MVHLVLQSDAATAGERGGHLAWKHLLAISRDLEAQPVVTRDKKA